MGDSFAQPQDALEAVELERFVHGCARERRSPMTHKTMDGHTYHWLERFVASYTADGSQPPAPAGWPAPDEADFTALGGFFKRVSARLREGDARSYATALSEHFEKLGQQISGWT
ncbi:MAG: hypothetical protein ACE5F5_10975 [Acidimicrobiia bacterium]